MARTATTETSIPPAARTMRRIRGLAAFLTVTATVFATAGEESSTRPAKPRTMFDAQVDVEEAPYAVRVFLQEGKSIGDTDAHVYYEPVISLRADREGDLDHRIDRRGDLVLFARFDTRSDRLAKIVREHLLRLAIETGQEPDLKPGTTPYRISVLHVTDWNLAATDEPNPTPGSPRVSNTMRSAFTARGNVAVKFPFGSKPEAEAFVKELNEGTVDLYFNYRFSGVSDETCSATLKSGDARSSDLFKKVVGEGGKGYVARHQVVKIAEQNQHFAGLEARCNNFEVAQALLDMLLNDLDTKAPQLTLPFDALKDQVAFDPDTFRADMNTKTKEIEQRSHREFINDVVARTVTDYKSKTGGFGAQGGYGPAMGGLNVNWGKAEGSSDTAVRKSLKDTLSKVGLHGEWEGEQFVPKSLDVHSTGELEAALEKDMTVTVELTDDASSGYAQILTREGAWAEIVEPSDRKEVGRRLAEMRERLESKIEDSWVESYNAHSALIGVSSCAYRINVRNLNRRAHYFKTNRTDDMATVAGYTTVGCPGDETMELRTLRHSKEDDNWTLLVRKIARACTELRVEMVYFDGSAVPKVSRHWTDARPVRGIGPKWCKEADRALLVKGR